MKKRPEHEQALLDTAHQVLRECQRLMLPHHYDNIKAKLEIFEEIQVHDINVTGIRMGRYKTNIILLTHHGQRAMPTHEMAMQDTVIIDLSDQSTDLEAMKHFLIETEECRSWHHAPWVVINMLKKRCP